MNCKRKVKRLLEKLPYGTYIMLWRCYKRVTSFFGINKVEQYRWPYFYKKNRITSEKYCIYRRSSPVFGILAVLKDYVFLHEFAMSKGFIPLMDYEIDYNFKQYKLGSENIWDYIFEQPITVKEALSKDYVIVEGLGELKTLGSMCMDINGDRDIVFLYAKQKNWREYYAKINPYMRKCWILKKDILDDYIEKCGSKIRNDEKILGVVIREEFSSDAKHPKEHMEVYNKHPLVPGIKETVKIVKKHMKKWNCDKIFVAAQCRESIDLFLQECGDDNVIFLDRKRMSIIEFSKLPKNFWKMNDKEYYEYVRKINIEDSIKNVTIPYIEEVLGVSECDYFIGAKCSATVVALTLNGGKYKDILILPDKNKSSFY